MSNYFVLTFSKDTDGFTPLTLTTAAGEIHMALFGSIKEAEQAASHSPQCHVFDYNKFEVPVPLIAPGTAVLVDGQWVVSA